MEHRFLFPATYNWASEQWMPSSILQVATMTRQAKCFILYGDFGQRLAYAGTVTWVYSPKVNMIGDLPHSSNAEMLKSWRGWA